MNWMEEKITKPQISRLWARANELGLSEEELRDLVEEVTGDRSISGLSKAKGIRVIDRLEGKGGIADCGMRSGDLKSKITNPKSQIKRKPVPLHNPKVVPLATRKQLDFIEGLRKKAGWEESSLMNFMKKLWKRDNPRKLRMQEAGVLIKVLKRGIEKKREAAACHF